MSELINKVKATGNTSLIEMYNNHQLEYVPNGGSLDLRQDIAHTIYEDELSAENVLVFPVHKLQYKRLLWHLQPMDIRLYSRLVINLLLNHHYGLSIMRVLQRYNVYHLIIGKLIYKSYVMQSYPTKQSF